MTWSTSQHIETILPLARDNVCTEQDSIITKFHELLEGCPKENIQNSKFHHIPLRSREGTLKHADIPLTRHHPTFVSSPSTTSSNMSPAISSSTPRFTSSPVVSIPQGAQVQLSNNHPNVADALIRWMPRNIKLLDNLRARLLRAKREERKVKAWKIQESKLAENIFVVSNVNIRQLYTTRKAKNSHCPLVHCTLSIM